MTRDDPDFEALQRYFDESNEARRQGFDGAFDPRWAVQHEMRPRQAESVIISMAERAIASCVNTIGSLPPCRCKPPMVKAHWWSKPTPGPLVHSDLCIARDRYDTEARLLMEQAAYARSHPTIKVLDDLMRAIDSYAVAGADYKSQAQAETIA